MRFQSELEKAILTVSTTSFRTTAAVLSSYVESYRPRFDIVSGVQVGALDLGAVTISTVRSDGHELTSVEPARWTTIMPVRGLLTTSAGGLTFTASSNNGVQLAPGKRSTTVKGSEGSDFIAAGLSVAFRSLPQCMARGHLMGVCFDPRSLHAARTLRDQLHLVVQEWARPGGLFTRHRVRAALEPLFLDMVETVWEESGVPSDPLRSDKAERLVRRAEAVLHARSDEPLRIADLASAAGVKLRTLQLAFRLRRNASPRDVLNTFRLERVRERLLHPSNETTVTDAAIDSGFSHLGRFAHAYRVKFGEAPSVTLARSFRRL